MPSRTVLLALVAVAAGAMLPACGGDEASLPASQIVADAAAALRSAHSLQLSFRGTTTQGPLAVDETIAGPGAASAHISEPGLTVDFILAGGNQYARGQAFFSYLGAAVAQQIGDSWVRLTGGSGGSLASLPQIDALATCLIEHHGTLSKRGPAVRNGVPVVEVHDDGDRPGTTTQSFFIATAGPAYPVAIVRTGGGTAGNVPAACGGASVSIGTQGTETFTGYNRKYTVTAPQGALVLPGS